MALPKKPNENSGHGSHGQEIYLGLGDNDDAEENRQDEPIL